MKPFHSRPGAEALLDAVGDNDLVQAKALLADGVDPNDHGSGDASPLIRASDNGFPEMVRLLIAAGASVNYENDVGDTPLNCAASMGFVEVVRVLIEAGATLDRPNRFGAAPLRYAADHPACAELLGQAIRAQAK